MYICTNLEWNSCRRNINRRWWRWVHICWKRVGLTTFINPWKYWSTNKTYWISRINRSHYPINLTFWEWRGRTITFKTSRSDFWRKFSIHSFGNETIDLRSTSIIRISINTQCLINRIINIRRKISRHENHQLWRKFSEKKWRAKWWNYWGQITIKYWCLDNWTCFKNFE